MCCITCPSDSQENWKVCYHQIRLLPRIVWNSSLNNSLSSTGKMLVQLKVIEFIELMPYASKYKTCTYNPQTAMKTAKVLHQQIQLLPRILWDSSLNTCVYRQREGRRQTTKHLGHTQARDKSQTPQTAKRTEKCLSTDSATTPNSLKL